MSYPRRREEPALKIGKHASLRVTAIEPEGLILDAEDASVLLPRHLAPPDVSVGDRIEIFIHTDRDGLPIATTQEPFAEADEFAFLRVKEVGPQGAFLDWGLDKDLLLPKSIQATPVRKSGEWWVVRVLCDPVSQRMVASTKLRKFLGPPPRDLEPGQEVELLFYEVTTLGVNAIVNGQFSGLLHCAPQEAAPSPGDTRTGFIDSIRPDGKVDLSLTPKRTATAAQRDASAIVLAALRKAGGTLALGDKSDPAQIRDQLGLSKKAFKKAIGGLLRARKIQLSDDEISLMVGGGKGPKP
jgi:predicted RNA-binding protein (virulence factor B family)